MEVDKGMKLEETSSEDFLNSSAVKVKKEYEECIGCIELQDKLKKANDKCAYLELDVGKKNSMIEWLEGKLGFMELQKLKIEDEVRVLKQRSEELEKSIINVKEEHDKLMVENKALECEKNKAESEIEVCKVKCKELEIEVMELNQRLLAGTPPINTPSKQYSDAQGFKGGLQCVLKSTVRKCLDFAAEGSPHKTISPSTPGDGSPFAPIDISDNDDDFNTKRRKVGRGVAFVVTSESDTDDNIPICSILNIKNQLTHSSDTLLKRKSVNGSCFRDSPRKLNPRRRLRRIGDHEDKGVTGECSSKSTGNQKNLGISENMNDTLGEDEMEEGDSSSEGESLDGFIVNSSETDSGSSRNGMSEHDGSFSGDRSDKSENAWESSMAYNKVISGFRRDRKDKLNWEFEADMLADFGKCPDLCMKAVCALYRQQTSEEKSCKATIIRNGRGFNQIHALSGSALAEFLTNGDPKGDVNKSLKELQEFNSKGVEQCRKLATHYSKQLFEIYKNKEDPFFHP